MLEKRFKDYYFNCLAMIRDIFNEVHMSLFFKVPVDGIPSFKLMNCTSQLDVICKLVEDSFNPTGHVIAKDNKFYWSQYGPLKYTAYFPLGH